VAYNPEIFWIGLDLAIPTVALLTKGFSDFPNRSKESKHHNDT